MAQDEGLLGSGPRKKVAAFVALMTRLRAEGAALGPASLAEKILEESGYRDALASDATMEAEGRIENLLELVAQMREYEKRRRSRRCTASWSASRWCPTSTATIPTRARSR